MGENDLSIPGKFHLVQDLAARCFFGATDRKAYEDATKSGKLLSRLDEVAKPAIKRGGACVWPSAGSFFAPRIQNQAEGEECQMY